LKTLPKRPKNKTKQKTEEHIKGEAQQWQGFEEAGRVCIQSLKARITDGHRVSSFRGPQQIISRGMLCGLCQHVRLSNTSVCQEQWLDYKGTQPGLPGTNTIAVNC